MGSMKISLPLPRVHPPLVNDVHVCLGMGHAVVVRATLP